MNALLLISVTSYLLQCLIDTLRLELKGYVYIFYYYNYHQIIEVGIESDNLNVVGLVECLGMVQSTKVLEGLLINCIGPNES